MSNVRCQRLTWDQFIDVCMNSRSIKEHNLNGLEIGRAHPSDLIEACSLELGDTGSLTVMVDGAEYHLALVVDRVFKVGV